mgnify:CR=1 FL=1|tara:strand:+ start:9108 stop:9443 length:336 start_codon:yes stop_codon:yes gene_type:complete
MSLKEWFGKGPKGDWVDISRKKKDGSHPPCGRKKASTARSGYPKCVPRAKANRMSSAEKRSAVRRKRAKAQGVGGKPTNVRTDAPKKRKTKKAAYGGKIYACGSTSRRAMQ